MNDKSGFTPPEQRVNEHAPLDSSDLEYLDRLVMLGEGLLLDGIHFKQAETLLRTGHAEVVRRYGDKDQLRLIQPTEAGKTLAALREKAKLARLEVPGKLPLKGSA